jgi:ankyrin repeat protein
MSSTEDLFRLADEGGPKLDALLRQSNVDINSKDSAGRTALSIAVERNKIETVKLLLRHNSIDVNAGCNYGHNPIWYGAQRGYEDTVKLLLDRADIVVNPDNGNTPLIAAAREGHVAVVKLLLKRRDIDVGMKDEREERTALHWAVEGGRLDVVE